MEQLQQFYASQKEELRPVIFAARAIDLHELFVAVQARGGFSMVRHICHLCSSMVLNNTK